MTNAIATAADFDAALNNSFAVMQEAFDRLLTAQNMSLDDARKDQIRGLVGRVSVEFNNSFTSRMGDATYRMRRIRLSAPLWFRASDEERREVVIHELVHLITHTLFPRASAHGREWRWLMSLAGGTGSRTHRVDTSGLKRAGATFACKCRTFDFGATRTARARKGANYFCRACRSQVVEVQVDACEAATERTMAPASCCRPRFRPTTTVAAPAPAPAKPRPAAPAPTTKGTTADLVVRALADGRARTVAELAAAIGKSECATNRYARRLVEAGTLVLGSRDGKATFAAA